MNMMDFSNDRVVETPSPRGVNGRPLSATKRVVPPIVTNEQDRIFLRQLTDYIDGELARIDSKDPYQRFVIHKTAFEQVSHLINIFEGSYM